MTSSAPTLPGPNPRFARTDVCPHCGAPLRGRTCSRCALELVGPTAVRLHEAGLQADHWIGERARLVELLRTEAAERHRVAQQRASTLPPLPPPGPPAPVPAPVRPPVPGGWQPPPPPAPVPAAGPRRSVLSVQSLLVGVGALLLAVASIVFLAFSWDRLGISGRSVVVATMTLTVLGGALVARRARMGLTAEAVAALGAVLVVLDAVAVRVTGLAGEGMGRLTYAASAAVVCALVMGGVGRLGRLHSLGVGAALLVPLAPVLVGLHLALRTDGSGVLAWPAAGLLVAALSGLPGGVLAGRGARAEAAVLTWAGAGAAATAGVLLLVVGAWNPGQGALLAAGGAVLALLHTLVPARRAPQVWSVVAGAATAVAVALLAVHALDTWALLGAPMGVGLVALALRQVAAVRADVEGARGPQLLPAARAALSVLAVAALPALLVVVVHPLGALVAAADPWSASAATTWADAADLGGGSWLPGTERTASFVAVLAVAGVLAGWWRLSGAGAARRAAAVVLGVLVVCLPWQLDLSVLHVVATALLLAVGAAAAGHVVRRRSGWVVEGTTLLVAGAAVGTLGVLAAWCVEPLSVPVTVVGIAGLVLARRSGGPAVLLVPAVAAGLVVAGGVLAWTGAPVSDAALLATLAGVLPVLAATLLPGVPVADRRAVGGTGAVAVLLAAVPTALEDGVVLDQRLLLLLGAVAVVATALAVDPRRVWSGVERAVGAAALVPVLALLAAQAVVLARWTWDVTTDPALASAVVVTAALAGAATLHRGRHPLALVVELGATCVGVVVLAVALGGLAGLRDQPSWPLLVILAVGTAALSVLASRRWVAWLSLLLASGALWDRLAAAEVGTVEAFTVAPALVLLAAGAVTARRDGVVARPSTVTGLVLLVLPTAVASVGGPVWRPVVLLALAAAAVVAAGAALGGRGTEEEVARSSGRRELAGLLLGAAAVGVLAGPFLRSLSGPRTVLDVEAWSLPAGLVLAGAAVVATRLLTARSGRLAGWAQVPALLVVAVPSLVAAGTGDDLVQLLRHLVPLLLAGVLVVLGARDERVRPTTWAALGVLGVAVLAGAVRGTAGPVELLTVPAGLALLLAGANRMTRVPALGSWPWTGPATLLALVPSLVLATTQGPVLRTALLTVGAAVVLMIGVRRRWQAPVLVGAGVLVVHAVVQLLPFVALAYQAVPRWASLALVGVVLLALGARYEARVRDVVSLRRRVGSLR